MSILRKNWALRISIVFRESLKQGGKLTVAVSSFLLTVIPESCFNIFDLRIWSFSLLTTDSNIIINRVVMMVILFLLLSLFYMAKCLLQSSLSIYGKDYKIKIEKGDLLEKTDGKIVIPFDECYTVNVGDSPADINENSICGQFLSKHKISEQEMNTLIGRAKLKPCRSKSRFCKKERFESGKILPFEKNYLLMAFAKLNEDGLATMSRKDIIDCLWGLWKEIDKYYNQKDIYMPILGSGVTRFGSESLTQQELLDLIIYSYKLSNCKIKKTNTLHIVYKKQDGFLLENIGKSFL